MFNEASNFSQGVDLAFFVILGISAFFLIGITAVMIYFVIRYRKKKNPKAKNIPGNMKLEVLWTVIPTLLVLVMFFYGWIGYKPTRKVPADAITIKANARMWSWSFEYDNGKISDHLVVPLDKPVKLDLISHDVIHSLYIPAFRIKEDVVPGKNNYMWFAARELGTYTILCAEYCGERHSYMLSKVDVLPPEEYEEWYNKPITDEDLHPGHAVLKRYGCISCHSLDGSKLIGPTFKGSYGRQEIVIVNKKEREITVDDEYLKESIYEPDAAIVKGYNEGQMISYEDQVSEEDVEKIIEFLKILN